MNKTQKREQTNTNKIIKQKQTNKQKKTTNNNKINHKTKQ